MNSGDRAGHGRRRGPAAGFPGFADPFGMMGSSGMGMGMGMMGGSSIFDDFFGRDPFDDPFFTNPMGGFGPLLGGGSMLGRGPMGMGMGLDNFFDRAGFLTRPDGSFVDRRAAAALTQQPEHHESRRGPVIEELSDDAEGNPEHRAPDREQPIVEHPDDDEHDVQGTNMRGQSQAHHDQNLQALSHRYQQQPIQNAIPSNNTFQSFSFSSSSSYGGSGGTFYSSSSMRRVGPDGVIQEEHHERDSSGKEVRSAARGLRHQVHAVTKKRNASEGPESTLETFHNLTPEEAPDFDAQWESRANRSLPGWNGNHAHMLQGNRQRSSHGRASQTLPYITDGHPTRRPRS